MKVSDIGQASISHPRTTVVNLRSYDGDDVVLVDRRTAFGNPFRIGRDGDRAEVIKKHKDYFYKRLRDDAAFYQEVCSLVGCKLACWCSPLPCHADTIAEFLNESI